MKTLTRGGCPSGARSAKRVLPRAPEFKRAFGDFSRASEKLLARRGETRHPPSNQQQQPKPINSYKIDSINPKKTKEKQLLNPFEHCKGQLSSHFMP
ncbi:hypothetical protein G7048_12980 [Diaphorobacter sp. HDW4B]|uniref:hypothetical protein n=1 Tax=Diaphorobacter sp. HDW4B TaxID=2714925 RepID=UPI001409612E|nr:hypothetical protein [Diaphorobacter sp. HDW4B]QIL71195.1 hypothetical protein G7048_12980 [Diaphorobacter sp. HDW4B]